MATAAAKEKEQEEVLVQFKRNLDHIQINTKELGPELTIGKTVLKFKTKPPVSALGALVGNENRVQGMEQYIEKCLLAGQEDAFTAILDEIDIEGLSEILNALGEGYTSFPEKS
jgi:hypothetical protein